MNNRVAQRKVNHILGLDKNLPLKLRKKFKRPEDAYRSNFNDWTKGNTGDVTYAYNEFDIPSATDACRSSSCPDYYGFLTATTGVTPATFPQLTLEESGDYSHLFSGAMTFKFKAGDASVAASAFTVAIADSVSDLGTNEDVYNLEVPVNATSEVDFVIDLSQAPDTVTGTGWGKATSGFAIRIEFAADPGDTVSFSTFDWFEDIAQVATPKLIKLYCLDGLGLSRSFETISSPCNEIVNISNVAIEFSATVQSLTDDINELQPNTTVTKNTSVLKRQTVEKTVEEFTDPDTGVVYGSVTLNSISDEVCTPVDVLVTSQCVNGGSRILEELIVKSNNQPVPDGYFHIARGMYNSAVDNRVLLNSSYVGETVAVDFYIDENGTLIVETDNYENVETQLFWDYRDATGKIRTLEIPQAVITAFNDSVGQTDPFTKDITFQVPATDGEFIKHHIAAV